MKKGQIHQIDKQAAEELQNTLVGIYKAGNALSGIANALVEIGVARENEDKLYFLNSREEGHLWDALILLSDFLNDKSYKQARRFGLEEPS